MSLIFKKFPRTFSIYFLIFLISGAIGCFIRLYPLRHYVSHDAWDKASLLVMNSAIRSIRSNINQQVSPSIPSYQKDSIMSEQLNTALSQNKKKVRETILEVAKAIDQKHQPVRGAPYLLASDSYYFYDLTQTILKTGRLSPQIKGSKYFNIKMTAPDGYWDPLTLHPYIGLGIYKLFSFFQPDIDLMFSVSFTPLLITLLILIIFLSFAHILKMSKWATLITACHLVCIQILLKRSAFAWYDNDVYNVLFPMLMMLLFFLGLQASSQKGKILIAISLALTLILYSLFWQGWMFMAVILFVSGCALIVADIIFSKKNYHFNCLFPSGIFLLTFLTGMSLLMGWKEIFILFQEGWQALSGFLNTTVSVWPETYIAVGELKKATPWMIVDLTGGPVFFSVAVLGIITGIIHLVKNSLCPRTKIIIASTIFLLAGIAITFGAQRFALLCVTPLTILFLFGINDILQASGRLFPFKKVTATFLAALLIIPTAVLANRSMPVLLDPIYNDTWNDALISIRANTPQNTIVNSWWPPGHFIKAIADRRVIFDGATINNRQAYWLANAFLAETETKALNYFRLANNSGNQAVDLLINAGMTDAKAASFLKHLIHLPEPQARSLAETVLKENADRLIALTHKPSEPGCILLYNEMIQKFLLLPFVAKWSMETAEELNRHPDLRKQIPSSRSPDYITFLWSLAGGYPKISGILSPTAEKNGLLIFQNHMIIDLNTKTCRVDSPQYGQGIPAFLIYKEDDAVIKKPLPNASLPYSVVIGQRYDKYEAMLMETPLAESLLIRLYFFGDTGLKFIRQISRHANLTRQMQIDVFKIGTDAIF